MKVSAGFTQRLKAEADRVRSGGKDMLRRFKTPTMTFPVSEGMSDAPTSTDLAPPGRLAASKKDDGLGPFKLKNILLFPAPVFADKASVKENRTVIREQKTPDTTMPLDEKSVGTITFDTSKGSTMVADRKVYVIGPNDVGHKGFRSGMPWGIRQTLGRVMERDIGKHCYFDNGVWQCESDEQMLRRQEKLAPRKIEGAQTQQGEGVFEAFSTRLGSMGANFPSIDGQTYVSWNDYKGIARGDRVRFTFKPGPTELKVGSGGYTWPYPELVSIEKV